jgi:hypothetical protein
MLNKIQRNWYETYIFLDLMGPFPRNEREEVTEGYVYILTIQYWLSKYLVVAPPLKILSWYSEYQSASQQIAALSFWPTYSKILNYIRKIPN